MAKKLSLPDLYVQEYSKYKELYLKGTTRTSGVTDSWESTSSSTTYNYTNGEEELITLLYDVISNYLLEADNVSRVDSDVLDYMLFQSEMSSSDISSVEANPTLMSIINNSNIGSFVVPAGAVMPFAMSSAPDGWLECDGSAVSRSTYSTLFAQIGDDYGAGDGSTTFNLPDLRGEFIRGFDNGRGVDSGRSIGSSQDGTRFRTGNGTSSLNSDGEDTSTTTEYCLAGSGSVQVTTTYERVRPRNIAMMYCIKVA